MEERSKALAGEEKNIGAAEGGDTAWEKAWAVSGGRRLEVTGWWLELGPGEAALPCGLANNLPPPLHTGHLFLRGRPALHLWRGQL